MMPVWKSEDNFQDSDMSFPQALGTERSLPNLRTKHLYVLSHLNSLHQCFKGEVPKMMMDVFISLIMVTELKCLHTSKASP